MAVVAACSISEARESSRSGQAPQPSACMRNARIFSGGKKIDTWAVIDGHHFQHPAPRTIVDTAGGQIAWLPKKVSSRISGRAGCFTVLEAVP